MAEKRKGKIINIITISGKREYPLRSVYIASQYAILGLTKALSQELAAYNIQVNAVCPFLVETEGWDEQFKTKHIITGLDTEEIKLSDIAKIPLGRPATPSDISNTILFLSSGASDYITGQVINVSGGLD